MNPKINIYFDEEQVVRTIPFEVKEGKWSAIGVIQIFQNTVGGFRVEDEIEILWDVEPPLNNYQVIALEKEIKEKLHQFYCASYI